MTIQTLAAAYAKARSRNADLPPVAPRPEASVTDDTALLNALRNSVTDCDQLLQRRIGAKSD